MGYEIEHKYLVKNEEWRALATESHTLRQGYLCRGAEATVRVRICDERGFLTVKGLTRGDARVECEYEVPLEDALQMLALCSGNVVEKTRHLVPYGGFVWEVDVFAGRNVGLVLAEIELPASGTPYPLPPFVGENVTGRPEYYNSNL